MSVTLRPRSAVFNALALAACLAPSCRDAPAPTEGQTIHASTSSSITTSAFLHGTTILQPASDAWVQLSAEQVSSFPIETEAEFWINMTTSGDWYPGSAWIREIRWRTCGSAESGTTIHSASTPILTNNTYDEWYLQHSSFAPGAFGQYEIVSKSTLRRCPFPGACSEEVAEDRVCVTLSDSPPPLIVSIDGPEYVFANQTETWIAVVSGGTTPYAYQWYVNGSPGGNQQSLTMDTGGSDFVLRVDLTDAASATGSATMSVTVNSCPPPQVTCEE